MNPNALTFSLAGAVVALPVLAGLLQRLSPKGVSRGVWLLLWALVLIAGVSLPICFLDVVDLKGAIGTDASLSLQIPWLRYNSSFSLGMGLYLDGTSVLFLALLAVVASMVAAFSETYLATDADLRRYRLLLGTFTTAMAGLVVAADLMQLFIFWELVGATSFALIGFWHTGREAQAASFKAFILNRIGDAGLLSGVLILMTASGTASLPQILNAGSLALSPAMATAAGLCLLLGAAAKSAQVPLQVWLPDAMAGPTSASALIHAATMVAAGVYLLVRVSPLLTPTVLLVVALTGCVTALLAALSALVQTDIKRILAYSTVSQLGLMVAAVGFGAPQAAFFHLITHAFFKSGLFLSAGALFVAAHNAEHEHHKHHTIDSEHNEPIDVQDIRHYGGLWRAMPRLSVLWLIFGAALVGLPLTAGFLSKENIWSAAYSGATQGGGFTVAFVLMASVLVLTGVYTTRLLMLLLSGKPRAVWLRDNTITLTQTDRQPALILPLCILALGALSVGYALNPLDAHGVWLLNWLAPQAAPQAHTDILAVALALGLSLLGIGIGLLFCRRGCLLPGLKRNAISTLLYRHFYWDDSLKTLAQALPDEGHSAADRFLHKHFYWDEALRRTGRNAVLGISTAFAWLDRNLVDGIVRAVGAIVAELHIGATDISLGAAASATDRHLVDGAVRGVRGGTLQIGTFVRRLQTGRLQTYLLLTLLLLGLLAAGFIIWII